MEGSTRVPAEPLQATDDPWAGLAGPEAPSPTAPVPGDAVVPVMPWDVPDPSAAPAATVADPVAGADPVPVAATSGGPEPVPTALAASASRLSFPPGVADKLGTYVYLLVDARTGRPFLVARGRGDRCFRHVEAARDPDGAGTAKFAALDRIREAESDGRPVRIEVLRHGLTAAEADLVVDAVDDVLALGRPNRPAGQRTPAVELGASLARRAKIKRGHPAVLLRVGAHGAGTAYDTARHGWRIGRRWVDTTSPRSPRWAVVVAGDLVEAVYRIQGWEPSPTSAASGAAERWSFIGERDPDLEARYVGRSVAAYLGAGTTSQVTYVWCGPHWVNTAQ